jgi:hypothetical protein
MSGDGSNQQQQPAYQPALDPRVLQAFPGTPTNVTIPQAMPGQLEDIAAQLASGYGRPQSEFLADLDNLYAPTNYQAYGREGPAAAAPSNGPAAPSGDPGAGAALMRALGMPDPESMPYEQWNTLLNNPSRVAPPYGGVTYGGGR